MFLNIPTFSKNTFNNMKNKWMMVEESMKNQWRTNEYLANQAWERYEFVLLDE